MKPLSLITLIATFLLLLWGGVVHNTGSGLACPDWPLCYGEFFPTMKGGILIEHGHRLLASLVGLLTIALVIVGRHTSPMAKLTRLALAFVVIQGMLGGITVIYRLPTIVSTTHLGLAMIFFCTVISICHQAWAKESAGAQWDSSLRAFLLLAGALLYAQILLGAFMRHSGAGAACGFGPQSVFLCRDIAHWGSHWWPPAAAAQAHMFHRYLGVALAALLIGLCVRLACRTSLGWPVWALAAGIVVQVGLGAATVAHALPVGFTTAHLGLAALCLGLVWFLYLRVTHLSGVRPSFLGDWIELARPKLTGLVVLSALIGIILAPGKLGLFSALAALGGIWAVAIAAVFLNGHQEREVDKLMERTRNRALPAGRIKPALLWWTGLSLLSVSLVFLAWMVNLLSAALALAAALIYLLAYTPLKRHSPLALPVGALAGAVPPVLGWTAATGSLDLGAWLLFVILFVWQIPHFLAIALYYAQDYRRAGLRVYPNHWPLPKTIWAVVLGTVALNICSVLPVWLGQAGRPYLWAALGLGAGLLGMALVGFFREDGKSWAKSYFWGSIFYLPLLLGAMVTLL